MKQSHTLCEVVERKKKKLTALKLTQGNREAWLAWVVGGNDELFAKSPLDKQKSRSLCAAAAAPRVPASARRRSTACGAGAVKHVNEEESHQHAQELREVAAAAPSNVQ